MTRSESAIVFEAPPVDDPQARQPDITRARQVLGWEPEVELEEGGANARRIGTAGTPPVAIPAYGS
jgi:dTDP-glucose 4,6-dehydratase